jgi:hypothetical protein
LAAPAQIRGGGGGAGIDSCHTVGFATGVFNCEHMV